MSMCDYKLLDSVGVSNTKLHKKITSKYLVFNQTAWSMYDVRVIKAKWSLIVVRLTGAKRTQCASSGALLQCHSWLTNQRWVDDGSSQSSMEVSPGCDCNIDTCPTTLSLRMYISNWPDYILTFCVVSFSPLLRSPTLVCSELMSVIHLLRVIPSGEIVMWGSKWSRHRRQWALACVCMSIYWWLLVRIPRTSTLL